jgi:glycosyltransferase involved in cell wall biosynthesis
MMVSDERFPGKVGVQQRVLPTYRVDFFDRLAPACSGGLSVLAGEPRPAESIQTGVRPKRAAFVAATNLHLLSGWAYTCVQLGLMRWLRDWEPDVLILEASLRNALNPLAVSWMHRRGRTVIGWGLGLSPATGVTRRYLQSAFFQAMDAIIAYSTVGAESYMRAGVPKGRVHVAVNAVADAAQELAGREPIVGRAPRVLFVGRLQARKRLDLLLRACAVSHVRPEVWIVGDGPERSALEGLARRVFPEARFLGWLEGQALVRVFADADLLVLPGTGGLAVQEAMAHGLPVVVAEGDGTQRDLVRDENGWFVPPGDLAALQRVIDQALSDPNRLRSMGAASLRIVTQEVNLDTMVRVFVRVLLDTVGRGR